MKSVLQTRNSKINIKKTTIMTIDMTSMKISDQLNDTDLEQVKLFKYQQIKVSKNGRNNQNKYKMEVLSNCNVL